MEVRVVKWCQSLKKIFNVIWKMQLRHLKAIKMIWHVPMLQGYQVLAKDIVGRKKGGGLIDHYGLVWCFRVKDGKEIMPTCKCKIPLLVKEYV